MLLLNNLNPLESSPGFHLTFKEHWKMTGGNGHHSGHNLLSNVTQESMEPREFLNFIDQDDGRVESPIKSIKLQCRLSCLECKSPIDTVQFSRFFLLQLSSLVDELQLTILQLCTGLSVFGNLAY